METKLRLKPQEPPFDHPDSLNRFQPSADKPFLATPGAIEQFGYETLIACLRLLQQKAFEHEGIDYIQVLESETGARVWFIEDGIGVRSRLYCLVSTRRSSFGASSVVAKRFE